MRIVFQQETRNSKNVLKVVVNRISANKQFICSRNFLLFKNSVESEMKNKN